MRAFCNLLRLKLARKCSKRRLESTHHEEKEGVRIEIEYLRENRFIRRSLTTVASTVARTFAHVATSCDVYNASLASTNRFNGRVESNKSYVSLHAVCM